MLLSLIFLAKPHEAMRPLGVTKPKYGATMVSFTNTPVPPSASNACTHIPSPPNNGNSKPWSSLEVKLRRRLENGLVMEKLKKLLPQVSPLKLVDMLGNGLRFGGVHGEDLFYVPVKAIKNQSHQQKQVLT
nr:hypothetical protein CFP56_38272 [Quercus suber]